MLLLLKNKKIQILLLSLTCTNIIFFLNKNTDNSIYFYPDINFRNLMTSEHVDERCAKTPKNFLEIYNDTSIGNNSENITLNQFHKALIEIIGKKDYIKIKEYLIRIIVYAIVGILDIFLIILWITFCGCCCCSKKNKSLSIGWSNCYFLLFFFFSSLVIFICVFGLSFTPCIYKSFNAAICSLYKLFFHFIEGTKNDFPSNIWKGVEGIKLLMDNYYQNFNEYEKLPSLDNCQSEEKHLCDVYKDYKDNIDIENNTIFMGELSKAENTIINVTKIFYEIKDNLLEKIEDQFTKFDKYFKLGLFFMFSAILGFCLLGLLSLTAFFVCHFNCVKCLFHLFWNIEMLIIIVTLLIGVGSGILGIVTKDTASILKYSKSLDNLNSTEPLIFEIDEDYKEYIDICFNGNGDLSELVFTSNLGFDESNKKNFEEFTIKYSKIKENEVFKKNEKLANAYGSLYKIITNLNELYNDLNSDNLKGIFDCNFIKNDFDILTNELNNSIAKKLVLLSLIIIIADLFEILAILFGVLLASKYKGDNVLGVSGSHGKIVKIKQKDYGTKIDDSSDNLRK